MWNPIFRSIEIDHHHHYLFCRYLVIHVFMRALAESFLDMLQPVEDRYNFPWISLSIVPWLHGINQDSFRLRVTHSSPQHCANGDGSKYQSTLLFPSSDSSACPDPVLTQYFTPLKTEDVEGCGPKMTSIYIYISIIRKIPREKSGLCFAIKNNKTGQLDSPRGGLTWINQ